MLNKHIRLCFDPNRGDDENFTPSWPLIIINRDGMLFDAATIRGAVAAVVGSIYLDAEDETDDWILRAEHARREAMLGMMSNKQIQVWDAEKGAIPDNYMASEDNPDYAFDEEQPIIRLDITTERSYLLSLAAYGSIRLMQRADVAMLQLLGHEAKDLDIAAEVHNAEYVEFSNSELQSMLQCCLRSNHLD